MNSCTRFSISQPPFLPVSREEGKKLGIEQFDVILISGDAYVDHPSFGTALIGRALWDAGFSVGIIAQPDWKNNADFTRLGTPRLFFGISSGNVDSMVNNLTPNLKRRSSDVYSPGGEPRRPDRATVVYANLVHAAYPGVPIVPFVEEAVRWRVLDKVVQAAKAQNAQVSGAELESVIDEAVRDVRAERFKREV